MFRLLFSGLKLMVFIALILVLGSAIEWKGSSVSDHISTSLAQAKHAAVPAAEGALESLASRSAKAFTGWRINPEWKERMIGRTSELTRAARTKLQSKTAPASRREAEAEELSEQDRQELRSILRSSRSSRQ